MFHALWRRSRVPQVTQVALSIAAMALLLADTTAARAGPILDKSYNGGRQDVRAFVGVGPVDRAQTFTVGIAGTAGFSFITNQSVTIDALAVRFPDSGLGYAAFEGVHQLQDRDFFGDRRCQGAALQLGLDRDPELQLHVFLHVFARTIAPMPTSF
jgi:hypothetical protein